MFKFLLIVLTIFFLLRIVTRYVLRSFMNNVQRNVQNQKDQQSNKKEGEVTIKTQTPKGKKISNGEGDYVDYDEVQ